MQLELTTKEKGGLHTGRESTKKVLVTPKLAAAYLEKNTQNRPLTRIKVERFKAILAAGAWQLTHQGIAFDSQGVLVDGQHRLTAIVESEIAAYMFVSQGMAAMTRATIDTLGGRKLSHTLGILGGATRPNLEAAMLGVINFAVHGYKGQAMLDQAWALRQKHVAGFNWITERVGSGRLYSAPVMAAFAYAYPAMTKEIGGIFADYTADEAKAGDKDPILKLRNFVLTAPSLQEHRLRAEMFNKALSAFYMRLNKQKRDKLNVLRPAVDFFRERNGDK